MTPPALRLVTWNVHRARGRDGRLDPGRVLGVIAGDIADAAPDLLLLQEADADPPPHEGLLDPSAIEAATGLRHAQADPATRWGPASLGFLGVAVFAHPRLAVGACRLLDLPGRCPRGAVVLDLAPPGAAPLRLVATHLSLAQWLRAVQLRAIGQHLARSRPAMDAVIAGDLNEWRPWGGLALSRRVAGLALHGPARATFPTPRPVLPLDRALGTRPGLVAEARALDGPAIRAASDHHPLLATIAPRALDARPGGPP